jgi:cation diffusion facilitator family transporter
MPDIQEKAGQRVTLLGALINAFLIVLKFVGGYMGHSQALIADAIHSFSDFFTDIVVFFGLKVGRKPADEDHPFGHARIETMASTIVAVAIIVVAVIIAINSGRNVYFHRETHPTWLTVIVAFISIWAKEGIYQYTIRVGRKIKSPVVIANAWHHRSDALSSVAVLFGVAGAQVKPNWHILDAYAALIVAFLILRVGLNILWNSAREFTDTAPDQETIKHIESCALKVAGVGEIHDLKTRTSGGMMQMELHIVVGGDLTVTEGHRIAKEVEACIIEDMDEVLQITVHVDPA